MTTSVEECRQGLTIRGALTPFGVQNLPVTVEPGALFSGVGENVYVSASVTWIAEAETATLFFPLGDQDWYRPVELNVHQTPDRETAFLVDVIVDPHPIRLSSSRR